MYTHTHTHKASNMSHWSTNSPFQPPPPLPQKTHPQIHAKQIISSIHEQHKLLAYQHILWFLAQKEWACAHTHTHTHILWFLAQKVCEHTHTLSLSLTHTHVHISESKKKKKVLNSPTQLLHVLIWLYTQFRDHICDQRVVHVQQSVNRGQYLLKTQAGWAFNTNY